MGALRHDRLQDWREEPDGHRVWPVRAPLGRVGGVLATASRNRKGCAVLSAALSAWRVEFEPGERSDKRRVHHRSEGQGQPGQSELRDASEIFGRVIGSLRHYLTGVKCNWMNPAVNQWGPALLMLLGVVLGVIYNSRNINHLDTR